MTVCTKSLLIVNRLLIKSAILMPTAKDGEVSIVQVVSQIYTALQCGGVISLPSSYTFSFLRKVKATRRKRLLPLWLP